MKDQLHEIQLQDTQFELERWVSSAVFTWQWWFMLALLIIPWVILVKVMDRERAHSIWCFGLMVLIITSFVDDLGAEVGIWVYPIKLAPYSLIGFPFDFSIVPVTQMILFQCFKTGRSFSAALWLQSVIFAFIGEPFSIWSGIVAYYGWTYAYSFVFYMVTGTLARAFVHYWNIPRVG
ncbi:hypothetical protein J2T17_007489 [Paenibacillus mucilaginosus]|uniref:CBO0543 family protein n=1 Tax=Paenibacillus mucilaginosus TaxID=61624 RepID=UPI003D20B038